MRTSAAGSSWRLGLPARGFTLLELLLVLALMALTTTGVTLAWRDTADDALNEEAVVCAALANKAGLNLVVSYEAFAVKMLGAMRQEMIFARGQAAAGRPPRWLSVPTALSTSRWTAAASR